MESGDSVVDYYLCRERREFPVHIFCTFRAKPDVGRKIAGNENAKRVGGGVCPWFRRLIYSGFSCSFLLTAIIGSGQFVDVYAI